MSYNEKKIAYDEDLKKYGYVKQSTINKFASEYEEPTIKKSTRGLTYLKKIQNDIKECWFITNKTVEIITWYIPPKPKKTKKKKVAKVKTKQTKKRDSYVYHGVFEKHYWEMKQCMICWSSDRLQIHHKDKNHKNNEISNLIMLCYKCHCAAHEWDRIHRMMIKKL